MVESLHNKALSFLRSFIRKMVKGRVEITTFGFWKTGARSFGLSLYWREK